MIPALRKRLDPGWQLALWLAVTLRVGLGMVALLAVHLEPIRSIGGEWVDLVVRGGAPWSELLSTWQRWDALWYQQIATNGYRAGDGTVAFYPLYPLLARIVALPLGGHVVLAQLVVSTVAFVVAMALLYRLAHDDVGPSTARLVVLLTAAFPVGFFLLAPYTESLFLALTLGAFWLARQDRPWAAGLVGIAASMTRLQGVFLVPALAFEYLRRRRELGERPGPALLSAALPPLGFLLFLAYQRLVVGETRPPTEVMLTWGYRIVPPWEALAASWSHVVGGPDVVEGLNLLCLLGAVALSVAALVRLPFPYALYLGPSLLLLLTRQVAYSPLMSVSRYVLVLFPCFIVLALILGRRPWLAAGWLVISALVEVMLFQHWVRWGFVA